MFFSKVSGLTIPFDSSMKIYFRNIKMDIFPLKNENVRIIPCGEKKSAKVVLESGMLANIYWWNSHRIPVKCLQPESQLPFKLAPRPKKN